jgi:hypothetical protein
MFQEHYDNKRMEGSPWTSCHHCLWFGQFDKMQGKEFFLGWLLILWSLFKTIHLHATVMFSWFFCSPAFLQKKVTVLLSCKMQMLCSFIANVGNILLHKHFASLWTLSSFLMQPDKADGMDPCRWFACANPMQIFIIFVIILSCGGSVDVASILWP